MSGYSRWRDAAQEGTILGSLFLFFSLAVGGQDRVIEERRGENRIG